MKKRTIIRPSGKLITYNEYCPKDFHSEVRAIIERERLQPEFEKMSRKRAARSNEDWKGVIHGQIVRKAWKIIIDRLMEKDRMIVSPGRHLVIGVRPGEKRLHNSWGEERNVSLHIQGARSNFNFRMSLARRKQLRTKVENGEVFHNAN